MKKVLALLTVTLLLASCGTMERWKERRKTKEETTTTSVTNTTVVEKIDTTVSIKKDSVVAVRPLDDLIKGKPIEATDGGNTVKVSYDPTTGNVRAVGITEAREVPVFMERTTNSDNRTDVAEKKKEFTSTDHKERKNSGYAWGIVTALVAVLIIIVLILIYRKPRDGLRW